MDNHFKFQLFGCDVAPDNHLGCKLMEINKGPDLDAETVSKLDTTLSGLGYDRIKQKLDKSYGDKYVWLKR